MKIEIVWKYTS